MANTDVIADLLIKAGEPDKDSSTALMVYKGSSLGVSSDAFLGSFGRPYEQGYSVQQERRTRRSQALY
jgi:hypothetical protein